MTYKITFDGADDLWLAAGTPAEIVIQVMRRTEGTDEIFEKAVAGLTTLDECVGLYNRMQHYVATKIVRIHQAELVWSAST